MAGRGGRGGSGAPSYKAVTVRLQKRSVPYEGSKKRRVRSTFICSRPTANCICWSKDQVAEVTREKSLMPKAEANPEEMRNLVAYVSRLAAEPGSGHAGCRRRVRGGTPRSRISRPKEARGRLTTGT